tara:strand:+ start:4766 stop:5563 length:798 start_codon:yes stop_codon:yes gene_type:complete
MIKTEVLVKKVREDIVKFGFNSGSSAHYGGALSMADFLTTLYNEFIDQPKNLSETLDRDYFILSKGHAALGLYSVLFNCNYFDKTIFDTYLKNETKLIAHPIKNLPIGIESSNGSLGQGISMATGIAHALHFKNFNRNVYCIVGDGECNEGIVYEAANYAAHYKLSNLCVFLDLNGFQNDGASEDILNIKEKYINIFKSIGWETKVIDGHNIGDIRKSLNDFKSEKNKPTIIIGTTVKGKGYELMESNNDWHHNKITEKIFNQLN